MKIAICGSSLAPFDKSVLGKSYEIGKEISINNHVKSFILVIVVKKPGYIIAGFSVFIIMSYVTT